MQLDWAFQSINRVYIKGCVEYFDSFDPNQWQETHDCLELALLSADSIRIKNQITIFENTCLSMLRDYKKNKNRIFT
jgi:hypothetical protein